MVKAEYKLDLGATTNMGNCLQQPIFNMNSIIESYNPKGSNLHKNEAIENLKQNLRSISNLIELYNYYNDYIVDDKQAQFNFEPIELKSIIEPLVIDLAMLTKEQSQKISYSSRFIKGRKQLIYGIKPLIQNSIYCLLEQIIYLTKPNEEIEVSSSISNKNKLIKLNFTTKHTYIQAKSLRRIIAQQSNSKDNQYSFKESLLLTSLSLKVAKSDLRIFQNGRFSLKFQLSFPLIEQTSLF
jgi:hypothetical protein